MWLRYRGAGETNLVLVVDILNMSNICDLKVQNTITLYMWVMNIQSVYTFFWYAVFLLQSCAAVLLFLVVTEV
jgi:hypothetical protein